jgi:hypothetical protein
VPPSIVVKSTIIYSLKSALGSAVSIICNLLRTECACQLKHSPAVHNFLNKANYLAC